MDSLANKTTVTHQLRLEKKESKTSAPQPTTAQKKPYLQGHSGIQSANQANTRMTSRKTTTDPSPTHNKHQTRQSEPLEMRIKFALFEKDIEIEHLRTLYNKLFVETDNLYAAYSKNTEIGQEYKAKYKKLKKDYKSLQEENKKLNSELLTSLQRSGIYHYKKFLEGQNQPGPHPQGDDSELLAATEKDTSNVGDSSASAVAGETVSSTGMIHDHTQIYAQHSILTSNSDSYETWGTEWDGPPDSCMPSSVSTWRCDEGSNQGDEQDHSPRSEDPSKE